MIVATVTEAAADINAIVGFSPIAIDSPEYLPTESELAVTDTYLSISLHMRLNLCENQHTSATGICHGPTH